MDTAEKTYSFGVDVGGTTVKLGLFDNAGTLVDKWEIITMTEGGSEAILPNIADSILRKLEEKNISADAVQNIGMGVPAAVTGDGFLEKAVNIGWNEKYPARELHKILEEKLNKNTNIRIEAANDANVAALGEMWQGAGKGSQNMIMVTLGTGVGGGIIINGHIYAGADGGAGEIGHLHVEDEETKACNCGNCGCLEQYASATGIVRLAQRRLAADDKPSVLRDGEVTAKTVFDAVKAQDELAVEIAQSFGRYLGKGLGMVASVVNPGVIVIGGGVSKAGDILIKYIEPNFKKYAFPPCSHVEFVMASLGNDAGIYGAARLSRD